MLQLQYRLFLLPQQHLRLPLFAMILQMTMPTPRARPNHVHFGTDTARPELKSAVHKHPNQLLRRHYANPQAKPNCVKSGKQKNKTSLCRYEDSHEDSNERRKPTSKRVQTTWSDQHKAANPPFDHPTNQPNAAEDAILRFRLYRTRTAEVPQPDPHRWSCLWRRSTCLTAFNFIVRVQEINVPLKHRKWAFCQLSRLLHRRKQRSRSARPYIEHRLRRKIAKTI